MADHDWVRVDFKPKRKGWNWCSCGCGNKYHVTPDFDIDIVPVLRYRHEWGKGDTIPGAGRVRPLSEKCMKCGAPLLLRDPPWLGASVHKLMTREDCLVGP